ncbi:hypothetical protein FQV10_0010250, partial [Eudyptes schlegeli]
DGFTPLMLASFCGGGPEAEAAEEEEGDEASAGIIGDLICQGASLGAQTDRTGETALHLAARYARADAAKRLLDAGADTNAQDNTGRTPLHAAVTADAQGVFQVSRRGRRGRGGCRGGGSRRCGRGAPGMTVGVEGAAVGRLARSWGRRVMWGGRHGRGAWRDATLALLKNGANKDMQDSKEETPLFLAAREGSYEAAKILLDHFANREITDHLDRLPRDIGHERLHHDIVRLLDEYNAGRSPPGSLAPNPALPPLLGPPASFLPGLKPPAAGKKNRRLGGKNGGPKGRGKKLGGECPPGLESSVTLSPVDSLDSPYVPNPTSPGLFPPPGL